MSSATTSKIFFALGFILTAIAIFVIYSYPKTVFGSAPSGLAATVATSSRPVVNTTAAVVFATSTNCAARIISTASSSIMVTFTDKDTPNGAFGFWQGASTTQVYDGGQYGCGQVKVYSAATQQITVQETR